MIYLLIIYLLTGLYNPEVQSSTEAAIKMRISELSESTAPGGGGAEDYGKVLHPDYTRWSMKSGEKSDKSTLLESIDGWFSDGWRVTDRETEYFSIVKRGDYVFSRRKVLEQYTGPEGESSSSISSLSEIWVYERGDWYLLSVDLVTF